VGASLNNWTSRNGTIFGAACTKVQIDIDAGAINKSYPVDVGIVGDARVAVDAIIQALALREHQSAGYRSAEITVDSIRASLDELYFEDAAVESAAGGRVSIDPRLMMKELEQRLPDDKTVVLDGGLFGVFPSMYLS